MSYQGKTDWQYDDIVTEDDMNRIEGQIQKDADDLESSPPTPVTLESGTQTITVDRDTPFAVLNIQGRTLINLLGRDGNCEDISRWGRYQVTNELDPGNKTNGSYGLKTIVATGYSTGSSYSVNKNDYQADKHYILIGMLKNGTATDTSLSISGFFNETRSNVVTDSSTFQVAVSKFTGLTMGQRPVAVNITGQPGTYSYADEIRLYEITEDEYNAIDSMTPEQVAAKYPYVDSLQNVNAVYINTKAEDERTSYMYLPTCQLASNLDGSLADTMYMDNEGKPRVVRQFRRVELDGSLEWTNPTLGAGYKEVRLPLTDNKPDTGFAVKYDGKIINQNNQPNGPDQFNHNTGFFRVTIANADSGWGPDYTPTADEVKAYFWGWGMYNRDTGDITTPYNGTGTRGWYALLHPPERAHGTYPGAQVPPGPPGLWSPYLLQYQLASPVDEPLEHEGSLMLYEGTNQVEVGTGIVVREKASPVVAPHGVFINGNTISNSKPQYRPLKFKDIFKDGKRDMIWSFATHPPETPANLSGSEQASIPIRLFDPFAVYQVTYLALDTYKVGIAPTEISAEYASNLRGTVDSLVEDSKNALSRISVVESQMQMKEPSHPQWITPALINGWVPYRDAFPVGYSKDSAGNVWIKGFVKGGTVSGNPETGTIFVLPKGYRPSEERSFAVQSETASQPTFGAVIVNPDGRVRAYAGNNVLLSLTEISFRAEQ